MNMTKWATFVGGVLFGTAGIKILSSKDAKKVYTHTTAAVLRAKDCAMATAEIFWRTPRPSTKSARRKPLSSRTHRRRPSSKP